MKRVISIVEDEKDINNLVAQYLRKKDMRFILTIHTKRQVHMLRMMMCICGS